MTTAPTGVPVAEFLATVTRRTRRRDAERLVALYERVTGEPALMWGPSIIGFGTYHYRYPSGREGDMAAAGFSPRAAATTIYLADGLDRRADLLDRLGPHRRATACLYVTDLERVDLVVLEELVRTSFENVTAATFGTRLAGPSA